MKKTRLIEILSLIREVFTTEVTYYGFDGFGMCYVINNLITADLITTAEKLEIRKILLENKPTAKNSFSNFFHSPLWTGNEGLVYHWWKTKLDSPQGHKIRYDYLTALIDKYSK